MPTRREQLLKLLEAHRDEIHACGVRSLGLFGSCVRGEDGEDGDLDFVVEFNRKSFDAYMDLKFLLERLFERRVDLVLADAIKPRIRESILAEAVHAPGL